MDRPKQQITKVQPDKRRFALPAALLACWAVFQLWSLTRYPAVTCDEGTYANMAASFLRGLGAGPSWPGTFTRFYLPHGRLYWMVLGLVEGVTRQSLYAGRLISLVGWGIAILVAYRLSIGFGGDRRSALLASALVATSSVNMFTGHLVRPDMLAAGLAVLWVALLPAVQARHSRVLYGLYGAALVGTLDVHFNPIHLLWPVALWIAVSLVRRRAWPHLGAFALGAALSGVAWIVIHTGPILPQLLRDALLDPNAIASSYLGRSESTTLLQELLFRVTSFARFWWGYFGAFVPFLLVPQGVLFLAATGYTLALGDERIRPLPWIILGSSLSFVVVNARYQLGGYSVMWYPLYAVVTAWALFDVGERVFSRRPALKAAPAALGVLLVLLNAGVDGYLARAPLGAQYRRGVAMLRAEMPPGSRVVTPLIWWHGLQADYEVVDEHAISMFDQVIDGRRTYDNILWIPPSESLAHDTRAAFLAAIPARSSPAYRAEVIASRGLRPDYVVLDSTLGCDASTTDISLAFQRYIEDVCEPVGPLTGRIQPDAVLYRCAWE